MRTVSNGETNTTTTAATTGDENETGATDGGDAEADTDLEELAGPQRENGEQLEIGEVFELLKNQRRRQVISFLKEQEDGVTTLDVLAEHIAAKENDVDVSQLSSSQRKRVYIGLYQCHLPKLDDFGVVEYQKNRGIIELQDTAQLDQYLVDEEDDQEEGRRELGVALGVAAVVAVGLTGIGPLAVVPAAGWTVLSVVALVALAADRNVRRSD